MQIKNCFLLPVLLLCLLPFGKLRANHVLGGEITWECQGGSYIFELHYYRDCNNADINTISENIRVWNHPSVTDISVNFISREDLSPPCTQTPGGPGPYVCGGGGFTGNGPGAVEKVVYRSAPVVLPGTPPANGWVFTNDNFSRSAQIVNLQNPNTVGMTVVAKMFASGQNGSCTDSSPQFLQDPYMVTCAGEALTYNMNAVDPDLDSLHFRFGHPLNNMSGQAYNPPAVPAMLSFEPGFSVTSPTPDQSFDPSNVPAQVDPQTGELTLTSYTIGSFVVKILVESYRDGVLVSEIQREMLLIIRPCGTTNNAPVVNGPFAGAFETTVQAGTLVNFTIASSDVELLQDGTPQSNTLTASGSQFGTNFTSNSGCANAPCATLNNTPPITGVQGTSADFSWQTACNHVETPTGEALDEVPYQFVFKFTDDYCPVPKVRYATVTVHVQNPGIIPAPQIDCITSDASGALTINWTAVNDPNGSFQEYRLYSEENGLISSFPAIGTTSTTVPDPGAENHFFLSVVSGCNGNAERYSDTISNIFLELTNPTNGTAILQWSDPADPPRAGMNASYDVQMEYPAGTWTTIATVPYGTNMFRDTITICDAFLNYRIVLQNVPCDFRSNVEGDQFEDMLTPDQPVITNVSIDPQTDEVTLNWNVNGQEDTYGYVIYKEDANGIIVEIDTVWGINNTSYSHFPVTTDGPLTYSVAAFDSCYTVATPVTNQTSAKAELHTTAFVTSTLNVCSGEVQLSWSPYIGWTNLAGYEVFASKNGQAFVSKGTTTGTSFNVQADALQNYCFVIRAKNSDGVFSYSNRTCLKIVAPTVSAVNYLQVATVEADGIRLRHLVDFSGGVKEIAFDRLEDDGTFSEVGRVTAVSNNSEFLDEEVDPDHRSYTYRARIIDSCGHDASFSNEATTILLRVQSDETRMINYLDWSTYLGFDGSVLQYDIYRSIDGVAGTAPLASVGPQRLTYTDSVSAVYSEGLFCYYVQAVEGFNQYGISERSNSNEDCAVLPPLIYIPNAFTPNGKNPVFIPVVSVFQVQSYRFTIFDRWGQAIFQTADPAQGWNGEITFSGEPAKEGVYVYMLSIRSGDGTEIVRRGHVTLLRD